MSHVELKLNCVMSTWTRSSLQLAPRGVPETTLAPLRDLFQTCNLVRYAPMKSSQELAAVITRFEGVLRELQGLKL